MRVRSRTVERASRSASTRERLEGLIQRKFGRIEEELVGSGLVDSLRAVELALEIEQEFGISVDDLALDDLVTLTRLVKRLNALKPELGA